MNKNEKKMVQLIREEYSRKLLELFKENVGELFETEMFAKQGNQLLSPGLKVRHKKSGYEYTIDHVEGDGDDAVIFLRHPETPRFKPPEVNTQLAEGDDEVSRVNVSDVDLGKVMGGEDEVIARPEQYAAVDPMQQAKKVDVGSLLKVSKKEFTKEYEVK